MPWPTSLSLNELGLPNEAPFPELAYHHPTGTIIARAHLVRPPMSCARLFIRRVSESHYSLIGDFPPAISTFSFAFSPTVPLLYFLSWREHDATEGGDWDALYRFTLDTRQCQLLARAGELLPPDPYPSASLLQLLSVSDDGQTLFCKTGLRRPDGPIDYCLSQLSLTDKKLTTITKLHLLEK